MLPEALKNKLIGLGAGAAIVGAASFIVPLEGYEPVAYLDSAGVPTACVGHTGEDIIPGVLYTDEQCMIWFYKDMSWAEEAVDKCSPNSKNLGVLGKYSLMSLAFNIGAPRYCTSSLVKELEAGNYRKACDWIPAWKYITLPTGEKVILNGLVERRKKEHKLCLESIPSSSESFSEVTL